MNDLILALETSCDETAAAVLDAASGKILASEISSQIEIHRPYGGVVPEVASRNHTVSIRPVVEACLDASQGGWDSIRAYAATAGPGLASSLLIGNTVAKSLAMACDRPFYAINHLEGHLLSPFQEVETASGDMNIPPAVGLVVSGGHTLLVDMAGFQNYRLLGSTRDDAAGEAFDKGAKLLGLPYPGGPEIEKTARVGDPEAYDFPRGLATEANFDFSFSGLKTSLRYRLDRLSAEEEKSRVADLSASYQHAIVEVLVAKSIAACEALKRKTLAVSGGVSCNGTLRERLKEEADRHGIKLRLAKPSLCTDNAAMIGFVAAQRWQRQDPGDPLEQEINPNLRIFSEASTSDP
ncbi:MAG: tRNA (adenosine(37)-N6)-threonylcarbamoyltransferase complex transferase subunit TsaD [Verrucomicrobiota bacterium]